MATVYAWASILISVLNTWQTLFAGVLALFGAWLTVRGIRNQITQTADLEKARLFREEQAAKAVLPLALAELAQYADDCIKLIAPYVPANGDPPEFPNDIIIPRIPEGTIEPLRDCARYADLETAKKIQVMLGLLQVQHTRLESLRQRTTQRQVRTLYYEGINAIVDAAEVGARMGELLLYAREKSIDPLLTFRMMVLTPLIQLGLIDHTKLMTEVDRRFPGDATPLS